MASEEKTEPVINVRKIRQQLERVCRFGAKLYLEGRSSTPVEIAEQCVREENLYMADYVMDDSGILKEIRYERVSNR